MKKDLCMKNNYFYILIFTLLISCTTSKDHYETFFIGNNQSQYFIKPIEVENDDSEFSIDYTIRNIDSDTYDITSNFTIISDHPISKIDSVILNNKHKIVDIDKLYLESKDDQFKLRSSMKVDYNFIKDFFTEDDLAIEVFLSKYRFEYNLNAKSNKRIRSIEEKLIPILDSIIE